MTAEELRQHSTKTWADVKRGLEEKEDVVGCQISLAAHQFQMLAEIAAQLAELVAEVRDVKADMLLVDEQIYGKIKERKQNVEGNQK